MIKPFDYKTRDDGVKLIRRLDVKVDDNENPLFIEKTITDENGSIKTVKEPIPTGFKIHKVGTDEIYDEAIDIENAPFEYEETDIPIETPEE